MLKADFARNSQEHRYAGTCPLCGNAFERTCRKAPLLCEPCSTLQGYKRVKICSDKGIDLRKAPRAVLIDKPVKEKQERKPRHQRPGDNPFLGPGHQQPSGKDIPTRKEHAAREQSPASALADETELDDTICPSCCIPLDSGSRTCGYCKNASSDAGHVRRVLRLLDAAEEVWNCKANPIDKPILHWDDTRAIVIELFGEKTVALYLQRYDICVRSDGKERFVRMTGSMKRVDREKGISIDILTVLDSILQRPEATGKYRLSWLTPTGDIVD